MKVKYIGNKESKLSVMTGKIYECLGKENNRYRIIDESGEDYLYPIDEFEVCSINDGKMRFGYTICDSANMNVYHEAITFIINQLGYTPLNDELHDVDDTICQTFKKGNARLKLESDTQINYVGIISDVELPIACLRKWESKD